MVFEDRAEAGRELADRLAHYAGRSDVSVLALPRGGVPVGFEIARALGLRLDVLIVRKLGAPGHAELAMGAIATGDVRYLNDDIVAALGITEPELEAVAAREGLELARRERLYRQDLPPLEIHDRTALLTDDGAATGASMLAAIAVTRMLRPTWLVVALPSAAREAHDLLVAAADEVVCLAMPDPYRAVGASYVRFPQVSDDRVRALLDASRASGRDQA